jgi:hypothetical protein
MSKAIFVNCIPIKNSWATSHSSQVNWKLWIECETCNRNHMVIVDMDTMNEWIHERSVEVTT